MLVPPDAVLEAARRWLEHLPASGPVRTHALFRTQSELSDLTPTQYASAYDWLQEVQLIDAQGRVAALARTAEAIREALLEASVRGALWLKDADVLIREPGELPEDALMAAEALGISPGEAFSVVRRAWGRVDTAERERIGSAGEKALVKLFEKETDVQVRHVAAEADGYGYDISVDTAGVVSHLEVKSTTRRNRLLVYLSRNEYETMLSDPDWVLVAVRLDADLRLVRVETVDLYWVSEAVPRDSGLGGRWGSVRLDIPESALVPGIPKLAEAVRHPLLRDRAE